MTRFLTDERGKNNMIDGLTDCHVIVCLLVCLIEWVIDCVCITFYITVVHHATAASRLTAVLSCPQREFMSRVCWARRERSWDTLILVRLGLIDCLAEVEEGQRAGERAGVGWDAFPTERSINQHPKRQNTYLLRFPGRAFLSSSLEGMTSDLVMKALPGTHQRGVWRGWGRLWGRGEGGFVY